MINIRQAMAKHLKDEFDIDPNVTALLFDKGVLSFQACRDLLIKEEYRRRAQANEKMRLRNKLAVKYCLSDKMIEKIVLQKELIIS